MTLASSLRSLKHRLVYGAPVDQAKAAGRTRSRERQTYDLVRNNLRLPDLPVMDGAICGIAMVKNEVDIVDRTVRHLLEQGLDELLIADNGSTDGTRELLAELQEELPLHLADDQLVAYEQSVKMTVLADAVTERECAWVVPFDADELWIGHDRRSVREVLQTTDHGVLAADLFNAFPLPDGGTMWNLDPVSHANRKVAFRAHAGTVVEMGNHGVLHPGTVGEGLAIVHLPWRSFEQFERKIVQGAKALEQTDLPDDKGWHWRELGRISSDERRRLWVDLLAGRDVPGASWAPQGVTIPFDINVLEPRPMADKDGQADITGRTDA